MAGEQNNYQRGWFRRRARRVNHHRLVFIEETAVNTAMTRRYGRAPRGERVHDNAPQNYGPHLGHRRDGAAEPGGDAHRRRRRRHALLQRLRGAGVGPRLRPGDVVVLDNLCAHRASRIEEVAAGRGAQVLWLAPYSPDFSPIEQCGSKIKAYLRGAKARNLIGL